MMKENGTKSTNIATALFMKHLKVKQEADTLVQLRNCIQASSPEQDRQEPSTVDHMIYNIP